MPTIKLIFATCLLLLATTLLQAQVGVGTSTPAASAKLEISSTTQGFLPPRMTTAQRDAISSPAAGLVIFNLTTNSLETRNSTGWVSLSPTYSIGLNTDLGGYVFFLSTDNKHGLVAETVDQSTSSTWYNAQDNISNKDYHSTDGKKFTDWRLPTKHELNLMYSYRASIGGFAGNLYWSSTELDYFTAWSQYFYGGLQASGSKNSTIYVRAIRAF